MQNIIYVCGVFLGSVCVLCIRVARVAGANCVVVLYLYKNTALFMFGTSWLYIYFVSRHV